VLFLLLFYFSLIPNCIDPVLPHCADIPNSK
jgi:hypothetical protein